MRIKSRTKVPVPKSNNTTDKISRAARLHKQFQENINLDLVMLNAEKEYKKMFGEMK